MRWEDLPSETKERIEAEFNLHRYSLGTINSPSKKGLLNLALRERQWVE
jgi:hypothetical protein